MKKLVLLFCMLFSARVSFANRVDDLKTDNDVTVFLKSLDKNFSGKYAEKFIVPATEEIISHYSVARKWNIKNWEKIDINNDGRTDLLVVAQWGSYMRNYVAIDNGDNTFQLININYSADNICEMISSIKDGNDRLILFHVEKPIPEKNKPKKLWGTYTFETDTLIYKFNTFIERNKTPSHYKIDSITFSTGPCLGTCVIMEIKIGPTGSVTYIGYQFTMKTGTFKCNVKKEDLADIYALINYMSIKNLKNNYAVAQTDEPTFTVRVKFSDGSVKEISDYGEMGTFGLRTLYPMFFNLTENQKWIAVKHKHR